MLVGAEIVFCPYNYLIDPGIRKSLDIKVMFFGKYNTHAHTHTHTNTHTQTYTQTHTHTHTHTHTQTSALTHNDVLQIAESVILFDEAHNIETIASETASMEFDLSVMETAIEDLKEQLFRQQQEQHPDVECVCEMVNTLDALCVWVMGLAEGKLERCAYQKDTAVYEGNEIIGECDLLNIVV
jgi:hypothetical protein